MGKLKKELLPMERKKEKVSLLGVVQKDGDTQEAC